MSVKRTYVTPQHTATWYPTGHRCEDMQAGDVLLVHHYHSDAAWVIRAGAWLRPSTRNYAWTNHACVAIDATHIVQEVKRGAVISDISTFDAALYCVIRVEADAAQIDAAVEFTKWLVGSGYGFIEVIADGIDDLTGVRIAAGSYGRACCSAATCRALERMGLIPDKDPTACQPADLAVYFDLPTQMANVAMNARGPVAALRIAQFLDTFK